MTHLEIEQLRTYYKDCVKNMFKHILDRVPEPLREYVFEFADFLNNLVEKFLKLPPESIERHAYRMTLLCCDSDRKNVVRAKLNAFYAFLVYRGYFSTYKLLKSKLVSGGESIYTWLRMYREILGQN